MKAPHPSTVTAPARRRLRAIAMPVSAIALGAAATILGPGRDSAVAAPHVKASADAGAAASRAVSFHPPRAMRGPDVAAPARRWPDEIEQLLASMPHIGDDPDNPPTIETDQRCSRVEDGIAHCVLLECQTAGGQSACFEMVVTARRLSEPPASMDEGAEEDEPDDEGEAFTAPTLLDTRHPTSRPAQGLRPVAGL